MRNNCPVCNKRGLLDYRRKHIICPQCNSDLRPFLLLHSNRKTISSKKYMVGLIFALLISFVFASLYFSSLSSNRRIIDSYIGQIDGLTDSIEHIHEKVNESMTNEQDTTGHPSDIIVSYIVKQGDHLSKIASFFYNDWRMYKEIAEENDLDAPYNIATGQTLIIKIRQ